NPRLEIEQSPFYVADRQVRWERGATPRRAAVNSLGVGGTNAHVILEEPPSQEVGMRTSRAWQTLLLSARTPSALEALTDNLAAYLRANPAASLADVSYTPAVGRHAFEYRRALVCSSVADALQALEARDPRRLLTHAAADTERPVAFLFAGVGDH